VTTATLAVPTLTPTPRRTRAAYVLSAAVIGLALFASVTPSPLYAVYAADWSFGSVTLTLIYATYAFGVLATLLLAGRVSDHVGRRPVLLVALGALALSSVVYMTAQSPAWLFAARGLQGLATGAALSAASAALLEFHPRRDPSAVGLANGVASAAGIALGLLLSSSLVQLGDAPRVLPYALLLALFLLASAGAALMPEPVEARRPFRLTVERPRVPAGVRGPFLLAALAVLSSWSIGGLFFSLGPELGGRLFHTGNVVVASTGVVVLAASAAASQLLFGRSAPWLGASAGSIALAAGVGLIVAAVAVGSGTLYLAGAVVGGVGFGIAFLGGLRTLVGAIPAHERAAVLSAFYVVAYASLSIPAVLAGIAVSQLSVPTTFEAFGTVVAAIALVVASAAWRTRPRLTP
jgi:predicted MFS family arabinose efflux permease